MATSDKRFDVEGCVLAAVAILFCFSSINSLPLSEIHERHTRQVADALIRKTFDFSATCPGNIILMLGDKQLNRGNLRLTAADAVQLAPSLYDQSFEDRIEVWCKVAKMTQELAESIGQKINVFNIEDLKLYQSDILLTKRTVDVAIDNDPSGQGRLQRTLQPTASNPDQRLLRTQRTRIKRKTISNPRYKWDEAVVPWRFDDRGFFTDSDKEVIREAIASWESKTCLRFPNNDQPGRIPHLRFIKGNGCYSYIGKDPSGQPVSIGNGCAFLGIVVHEIGHAIGLSHEQSRPDRNRYVRIDNSNIFPGFLGNFLANNWANYHTSGIPYDYSSVMHYAAKDFATVRTKDTVISLDPEMREAMGQRNDLSFWDAKMANIWYCSNRCSGLLTLDWSACQNNGYRHPVKCNECICPPGFAPPFCEDVLQNPGCGQADYVVTSAKSTFTSPGYNGAGHPLSTECAYRFTAPEGMRVKMKLVALDMQDNKPACRAFVEIRYKHMSLAGPKFCGKNVPTREFVSHGNTAMVTFLSKTEQNKGFQVEFSAESCGGCSGSSASQEPACLKTTLQDCETQGQENTCYDITPENKRFCCGGYSLSGQVCVASGPTPTTTSTPTTQTPTSPTTQTPTSPTTQNPTSPTTQKPTPLTTAAPTPTTTAAPTGPWSDWSVWSKCSRDCGNCGRQYRSRRCLNRSQCGAGLTFQTRSCNTKACPAGTPVGFCDEPRAS